MSWRYVRGEVFDDLVEFFEIAVLFVDLVGPGFVDSLD